ncbi:MAG: response regulator [bacterium]|nr:response regulator [bacterium]
MVKILIIEDERALMEDLIAILQYANYDAEGAGGGEIGLQTAVEWKPDLILCDIMMPGMDGFEVLTRLRHDEKTSGIPFIMLTARGDRDSMRRGMDLGADDYLTKPFSAAEMLSAVEARLKRYTELTDTSLQGQLEATKQQLARMVTHELRTPLISINMVLDVLSRQIDHLERQELAEMIETIRGGSQRLTHRVEQLVYLTQIDAGLLNAAVLRDHGVCVPLWDILMSSINLARRFAYSQQPGVTLETEDLNPEATVICNPPALKQALAELISNALKFSPANGMVKISQAMARGRVWVTITDQGEGIPEAAVKEALRPFAQINRERSEQQGIGMGLALAHAIIKAHGGELEIGAMIGHGTKVTLMLPFAQC